MNKLPNGGHPRFYELLEEERLIHSSKNADYATQENPLSNLKASEDINVPGYVGNFIRMMDKWARTKNLIRKMQSGEEAAVKSESIKDTLQDLAIYCKLEIILIEEYEKAHRKS